MKNLILTLLLSPLLLTIVGCQSGSGFDLHHKETHAYHPELPLKTKPVRSDTAAEQRIVQSRASLVQNQSASLELLSLSGLWPVRNNRRHLY